MTKAGAACRARSSSMETSTASLAERPFARLNGAPLDACPEGLYIPPEALRVFLERFEGPLDLLLYLIRSQKFDVMDIPMAALTEQYLAYVEAIRRSNLELAAAYLVMAATLMRIKSRMLLPAPAPEAGEEPEDPRAELLARLRAYEETRRRARAIDGLAREGRDFFRTAGLPLERLEPAKPVVAPIDVAEAWLDVAARARLSAHHRIARQTLSVREHMTRVLKRMAEEGSLTWSGIIRGESTRESVAVWYLALLELAKEALVMLRQAEPYSEIYVTGISEAATRSSSGNGGAGQVAQR